MRLIFYFGTYEYWNLWEFTLPPLPTQIDQIQILHPSVQFKLNLLSTTCKVKCSFLIG